MTTTVSRLRSMLDAFDDDDLIVLSRDWDGNGYSPLEECEPNLYQSDDYGGSEIFPRDYDPDYFDDEAEYEQIRSTSRPCIVFWPR